METSMQSPLPYADLRAFHGDPVVKEKYQQRLAAHHAADRITQGQDWNGICRGCVVWCTLEGYSYQAYADELGIPPMLAGLEDVIFETLPAEEAPDFAVRFLEVITVGADLSRVYFQWAHWMMIDPEWGVWQFTEEGMKAYVAIITVAELCKRAIKGDMPSKKEWFVAAYAADDDADAADAAANAASAYAAAGNKRQEWAKAARDKLLQLLAEAPVPTAA